MKRLLATLIGALAFASAAHATPDLQAAYDAEIALIKSVMMQNPGRALTLADHAEAAAAAFGTGRAGMLAAARAEWLKGEALSRLGRPADSLPMLDTALATVTRVAPQDRLHGDILLSRGWVREMQGAVAPALANFSQAFELYRAAGESRGQAKALQNVAGIYQDAGDIARAQRYYQQAAETYHGDPDFALAAYNNVGESLRMLGRYRAAQAQFELALAAAKQVGSPLLQANVLTNLASTHLLRGDRHGATLLANQALALSAQPAAADERPFAYGVLAQIAMADGNSQRASTLIGHTFAGVDLDQSPLSFRDFHKLAADIYADVGQPEIALRHLRAWKRLDDNVRAVAASTNAALMAAQFDFSTQNLRIVQLQANRARLHETVLVIVVAAVTLVSGLLLLGLLSLRRSRNKVRVVNAELTKALQVKSDFLAMTSHEIRTPLNGILGTTQVLLADGKVTGTLRNRIQVVHGAGETMRALVDDLLDLAKMESGRLVIQRQPVRLPALLTEAAALWRDKAEAKGIALALDLDGCPILIEEDGNRLRQILFNLLANAVKFTDAGSVRLAPAIVGDRLELSVADSGIGIASDKHSLIFEKFQQADTSTSRRFGGTGLGLAICRNLAEAMDGEIRLRSNLGEGSVFTLSLPLRLLDTPAEPEVIAPQRREGRSLAEQRVLLLEPNALTQRMVAKSLRAHVATVDAVASVSALLDLVIAGAHDHVVVRADSVDAGESTAGQAIASILASCREHSVRAIVLIGDNDAVDPADIEQAGAICLKRPVSGEALLRALGADEAAAAPVLAPAA